ncbi:thiol reductant ABC exporter subunit CydD [Aureimonas sp. ME7]|uniref:thiol reductant ABC exporter subunit CydD n=1 Tax=Aureimonas sp. ME7 TaxID=2744252 RepID=UPI0015FC9DF3|nr:thiol reductant ABC exporter subunit CydD [Aureimonas sp. ME7]
MAMDVPEERAQARWLAGLRPIGGWPLALGLAAPLLSGATLIAQAFLLSRILGRAIGEGAPLTDSQDDILVLGAVMAFRVLLGLAGEIGAATGAERIKLELRRVLFRALLTKHPDWTAGRPSGALGTALVDHVEALDGFFLRFLPATVGAAVLPLAFAAAVMPVDWVVGLLFLITAPLIPLFMALAGWGAKGAAEAQADALARLSGHFADRLRGLTTLALLGRGEAEVGRTERATDELRRRTLRVLRIAFLSSAMLEFFAALGVAGVALYVGLTYLGLVGLHSDGLTLQAGLFCLVMAPEVYHPLRTMAAHYHDRAGAKAAVAELSKLFGTLPDLKSGTDAVVATSRLPEGPLGLNASGLVVSTPDGVRTVLEGIDLSVAAGAHVALEGASGIGKSTLLERLAGLRAGDGTVLLGGIPLPEIGEATFRERVAFLPQRPHLFVGTIRDNIRFGRTRADDAKVEEAAARACVDAFARELPLGLDTPVGENGLGLSGGERHRVALARLYLRDPSLILLDEPTAHLDPATEAEVLRGLLEFVEGRTLLVATHSARVVYALGTSLRFRDGRLVPVPKPQIILETAA